MISKRSDKKADENVEKKSNRTADADGNENKDIKDSGEEVLKLAADKQQESVTLKRQEYEKLKEAERLVEEFRDKYLRAHAELDNARKRLAKEREEFVRFANEDLILGLLPIVDNLDRAMNSLPNKDKEDPHLKGVFLIKDELHRLLENYGVVKMKSLGEKFNPEIHEAVMAVETDGHPEGIILDELQAGYTMHGRLIRPAFVKVAKKHGGQ